MIILTENSASAHARMSQEIDRLSRLVSDLQAIRDGRSPTTSDLKEAPLLGNWERGTRPAACLFGNVFDHPMLPGMGRSIVTSDLWVLAADHGWARTLSRWYRLGSPRDVGRVS
jgi:hypothetical protein